MSHEGGYESVRLSNDDSEPGTSLRSALAYGGVFVASVLVQLGVFGSHLNNSEINTASPTSSDTVGYLELSEQIRSGSFVDAFSDGFRTPGYPLYLAFAQQAGGPNGILVARVGQVIAIAIAALLVTVAVRRVTNLRIGIVAGLACAAFVPFGHFATILYAEALSITGVAVVICLLTYVDRGSPQWGVMVVLGLTVLGLTMLKPNNLLIVVPVALFVLLAKWPKAAPSVGVLIAVVVAGLAPWTAFVSTSNGRLVTLSTTQGVNLLIGTGAAGTSEDSGSIRWAIDALNLENPDISSRISAATGPNPTPSQLDKAQTDAAMEVIRDNPGSVMLFYAVKGAYSLGFPPLGAQHLMLFAVATLGISSSVYLLQRRELVPWAVFALSMSAVSTLQAMVFLPNQRFRLTFLDLPAIVVVALAAHVLISHRLSRTADTPAIGTRSR